MEEQQIYNLPAEENEKKGTNDRTWQKVKETKVKTL